MTQQYGSSGGKYHPDATRASAGRFKGNPEKERKPAPETPEIVVRLNVVRWDNGDPRRTKNFGIFDADDDECIIINRAGLYVPRGHPLGEADAVEIVIRKAPAVRKPRARKATNAKAA